jgi:murein DD-endopeptidase MepM/ murein hydrolase activator NlpD
MTLVCLGAGVASAQTTVPDEEAPATTEEQPTSEFAPDGETQDAVEPSAAGDDAATDTQAVEEAPETQARGDRSPRLVREDVSPGKIYWAGTRKARFVYKHRGAGSVDLRIEAVKRGKGRVIKTWRKNDVPADTRQKIRWDGRKSGGGRVRRGRFFFRVEEAGGPALARKRATGTRGLRIRPAIFPVRARHDYWDGWGAGRGHQGTDVGARCGAPMVAAEAGRVAYKGYDGGGYGNYVVINVRSKPRAEVYAHLKRSASVRRGGRVKTGEHIGKVGATGNASGCHLHFEYWRGDYPGGHATPRSTKRLRAWDRWS